MSLNYILTALILLASSSLHADIFPQVEEDYKKALSDANVALQDAVARRSCPGVKVSMSCGNGLCEDHESRETCKADCMVGEIRSYNHQTVCTGVQQVYNPENASEVQEAVRVALQTGLKVKMAGNGHSANEMICTDGIVITSKNLKNVIALENFNGEETVNVEAGVTLGELSEWLHQKGKSLGYTLIGYRGVTVAGSTATGSHGSSPKHNSVMADLIRSVRLVNAEGEIVEYHAGNTSSEQWAGIKSSLGLLGYIVDMRLAVEDQFNLRVKTTYHKEKNLFKRGGVAKLMEDCDFGQINWFPGAGRFAKICGKRTTRSADEGATNSLLQPDIPDFIIKPFRAVMQYGACHNSIACLVDKVRYLQFRFQPYFKKKNKKGKLVSSDDVTGPSHRMTSSDFTEEADGFSQMDWEIAVPASRLEGAMVAVKEHIERNNICLPLIGVFIRFTRSRSGNLLAHSSTGDGFKDGELVAFIEMPVFLPYAFSQDRAAAYDRPFEDFARLLIHDHGGRAHWAKNRDWTFKWQQDDLNKYPTKIPAFQNVLSGMDPDGVFSNWFGSNIGLEWNKNLSNEDRSLCHSKSNPVCNRQGERFLNMCLAMKKGEKREELRNCRNTPLI